MLYNAIIKIKEDTYLFQLSDYKNKYGKSMLKYVMEQCQILKIQDIEELISHLDEKFGSDYKLESMNKKTYIF